MLKIDSMICLINFSKFSIFFNVSLLIKIYLKNVFFSVFFLFCFVLSYKVDILFYLFTYKFLENLYSSYHIQLCVHTLTYVKNICAHFRRISTTHVDKATPSYKRLLSSWDEESVAV